MKSIEQRRARIYTELAAVQAYRAMPQTQLFVALLDALAEDYLEDLASVKPDQLGYTQGALAQVRALRRAITSEHADVTPRA